MEQAEHIGVTPNEEARAERSYERYGWMILSVSAILGIGAAVVTAAPSLSLLSSPHFGSTYPILGAFSSALVGFNIFALVLIQIPYRRYERWAWYTLWMLPLQWLLQFAFSPDLTYLVLAMLTTVGLVLPFRRFFSSPE